MLPSHTRCALIETARDLTSALERAADRADDTLDHALKLYDAIAGAIQAVDSVGAAQHQRARVASDVDYLVERGL